MLLSKLLRGLVLHRGAMSLLGVALAWTFHAQAYADIWKYVDANGVTHFTNEPPTQNAQQLIPLPTSAPNPAPRASEPVNATVPSGVPVPLAAPVAAAAPVARPLNPAKALGDWPPKPLILLK